MNYFLVIFIDFFIFNSNSNLNFRTGCYRWVPLPYPAVAAVTAVYRAVTTGKKTQPPTNRTGWRSWTFVVTPHGWCSLLICVGFFLSLNALVLCYM
jgi:hypothetical protein